MRNLKTKETTVLNKKTKQIEKKAYNSKVFWTKSEDGIKEALVMVEILGKVTEEAQKQ